MVVYNLRDTWANRFVALAGGSLLGKATAGLQISKLTLFWFFLTCKYASRRSHVVYKKNDM
jgi:hypothetical protein